MTRLLRLLLVIVLTIPVALAGYFLARDPGQVLLSWFDFEVETTLVMAMVLVVLGLLPVLAAMTLWRLPRRLARARARARHAAMARGLRASLLGEGAVARPALIEAAGDSLWRDLVQALLCLAGDMPKRKTPVTDSQLAGLVEAHGLARQARAGTADAANRLIERALTEGAAPALRKLAFETARVARRGEAMLALARRDPSVADAPTLAEAWQMAMAQAATPEELTRLWQLPDAEQRRSPACLVPFAQACLRLRVPELADAAIAEGLDAAPSERLYSLLAATTPDAALQERLSLLERHRARQGDSPMLLAALGMLGLRQGRIEVAIDWLTRAQRLGPSPEAALALAEARRRSSDLAGAVALYREALATLAPEALQTLGRSP